MRWAFYFAAAVAAYVAGHLTWLGFTGHGQSVGCLILSAAGCGFGCGAMATFGWMDRLWERQIAAEKLDEEMGE